jgi:hypothetical protein
VKAADPDAAAWLMALLERGQVEEVGRVEE